ncbi:SDR family oxidoreductase [Sphingomonas sp.]|uniref:SDR family oxidoreductase n=1 Tax=Sphingomonas sp. TaxID=28214 RepID=UPI0025D4F57F|nr:SDR family oxidoreductase [Sphingomonas sp.]
MPVTIDLGGRVVLLTGALGSLGRAQARRLAEAGASLILHDHPSKADPSFARELADRYDTPCAFVAFDLGDLARSKDEAAALSDAHGGIDILINNAALIENRLFAETTIEQYEEQLRVNAAAAFALAQGVAPGMRTKGGGRIINFCSITLNGRWTGYAPYVMSKAALHGLTKALARELGPDNIRVNAIAPGAVVSDAEARVFGDRAEEYASWVLDNQCLKRRIEPHHIADAILFLASDLSEMVSGTMLDVTAGW